MIPVDLHLRRLDVALGSRDQERLAADLETVVATGALDFELLCVVLDEMGSADPVARLWIVERCVHGLRGADRLCWADFDPADGFDRAMAQLVAPALDAATKRALGEDWRGEIGWGPKA